MYCPRTSSKPPMTSRRRTATGGRVAASGRYVLTRSLRRPVSGGGPQTQVLRSSTGILARLEAPLDVPFRLFLRSSLRSASHSAQPVFALVVGIHVAAVALFAGNRRLVFAARGVPNAEVLRFVVLLR